MIEKLYEASRAGVKIDLIVRSICCLAPGVPGQSETIKVHRIVDRYLEHARVFIFHNNGNPEYYMGSADWMNRNLHSRVEVCFPVQNKELCTELGEIIRLQLEDKRKAVFVEADQDLNRIINRPIPLRDGETPQAAQELIYAYVKSLAVPVTANGNGANTETEFSVA